MTENLTEELAHQDPDFGNVTAGLHGGWIGQSVVDVEGATHRVEVLGAGSVPSLAQRLEFVKAVNSLGEQPTNLADRISARLTESKRSIENMLVVRPVRLLLPELVTSQQALWILKHPTAGEYGYLVYPTELSGPLMGEALNRELKPL